MQVISNLNSLINVNSCREFALDDLMAITAIPVSDFVPGTQTWQLAPTIAGAGFSPTLSNAVVIGLRPATVGGTLIPIRRHTGKAKDAESDGVAGRLHTVTVSCEVDDREGDAWGALLRLERTPSHLMLEFRGGQKAFAAATQDTYTCEVGRDGGKTSVSFRLHSLMGIQLITA